MNPGTPFPGIEIELVARFRVVVLVALDSDRHGTSSLRLVSSPFPLSHQRRRERVPGVRATFFHRALTVVLALPRREFGSVRVLRPPAPRGEETRVEFLGRERDTQSEASRVDCVFFLSFRVVRVRGQASAAHRAGGGRRRQNVEERAARRGVLRVAHRGKALGRDIVLGPTRGDRGEGCGARRRAAADVLSGAGGRRALDHRGVRGAPGDGAD
mmetsp:Transcript_11573/g.48529  ORF Transcript_11573/g.48529 Transcript_11573/m.48529 type:complete len:214 (-) Transcript_11573:920-1561(-)